MAHKPESVTPRWMRRYSEQRFRFAIFSEFHVSEMVPGTIVYDRLQLAIALQQAAHALRPAIRRVNKWLRRAAQEDEQP